MFQFLDNTPSPEKNDKLDKKSKNAKTEDNFSNNKEKKTNNVTLEGFSLLSKSLGGAEFSTNKVEGFDIESSTETVKDGINSLVALLPKQKEGMSNLKKKREGFANILSKREGMEDKEKEEALTSFLNNKENEENEENEETDKENKDIEGMVTMNMDKNTQVFAGGLTVVALLLVFKFMQGNR